MPGGFINGGFNIGRAVFPVPFGAFSPAAADYIKRLDSAGVRVARYDKANAALIDRLVGNGGNFWPASGAFCAMAGYLYPGNGANLIPLKDGHDAGTLNAFVTGDWNAVTGLKGDGSTKYVNSNRNNNADEQDDQAMGTFVSVAPSNITQALMGAGGSGVSGSSHIVYVNTGALSLRIQSEINSSQTSTTGQLVGLNTISRSSDTMFSLRTDGGNSTFSLASQTPLNETLRVFALDDVAGARLHSDARFPFYHIGPNLNGAGELAELDAALTEWKNALAAA